jgi:hypothetical protein
MRRHSGVTFKSKKHNGNELQNFDLLSDQCAERRRSAEAAREGRFLLQVDRQTKESFQTREDAQKAGMALKQRFPILHVGVLDVEEGLSEVIVSLSA